MILMFFQGRVPFFRPESEWSSRESWSSRDLDVMIKLASLLYRSMLFDNILVRIAKGLNSGTRRHLFFSAVPSSSQRLLVGTERLLLQLPREVWFWSLQEMQSWARRLGRAFCGARTKNAGLGETCVQCRYYELAAGLDVGPTRCCAV